MHDTHIFQQTIGALELIFQVPNNHKNIIFLRQIFTSYATSSVAPAKERFQRATVNATLIRFFHLMHDTHIFKQTIWALELIFQVPKNHKILIFLRQIFTPRYLFGSAR